MRQCKYLIDSVGLGLGHVADDIDVAGAHRLGRVLSNTKNGFLDFGVEEAEVGDEQTTHHQQVSLAGYDGYIGDSGQDGGEQSSNRLLIFLCRKQ